MNLTISLQERVFLNEAVMDALFAKERKQKFSLSYGMPIEVAVDGANRHECTLLEATIESIPVKRPQTRPYHPQGMCIEKGIDFPFVMEIADKLGYVPNNKLRGDEMRTKRSVPGSRARRCIVERTHAWINGFFRPLVRREKKTENYLGFLKIVSALNAFRASVVLG